jgi:hypothetical protein
MKSGNFIYIFGLILQVNLVFSQEKLTFAGGMSFGGETYSVNGIDNRRSPLSYYVNGRVSLSYKGINVPVSISYRDAQFSYDYNFNRLGIAPSYKWVKLYFGWNTMNFSQYTMSGRAFYGVGMALTPGNFHFSALKGKIQNHLAIRDTLINGASLIPTFERDIWGGKVGFQKKKTKFELIFMNIKDDSESFAYQKDYNSLYGYQVLTPKENLILGINGGFGLFKVLDIYFNTAASGFTADTGDTLLLEYGDDVPGFVKNLFQANSSTRLALAGDAGINLRIKSQKIGLRYRRVDPFYSTLASNFFMNDVEQYTFNTGLNLWKKKIHVDGNLGLEQNNLTRLRTNTTNRVISSIGTQLNLNEKWFSSIRFSNFQTESENNILTLNDTLRFVSTTQEYSTLISYTLPGEDWKKSFSFNAYYNTVSDQSTDRQIGDIRVLSLSANSSVAWKTYDLTFVPSLLFNEYRYEEIVQKRIGGGIKIQKRLAEKKVNVSMNYQYSLNLYDGKKDGSVNLIQLTSVYKVNKKNSVNLNGSYRMSESLINNSFNEFRLMLRYGLQF